MQHAVVGFVRSVAPQLARRGIRIQAVCPGWADTALTPPEFKQNLVATALKFVRPGVPPQDDVAATRTALGWWVTVADNGPGVPLSEWDRVFEPFNRVDKSVPGAGIGLSTCKRIVEAHGGRIGLSASPTGGALVWFELPD